MACSKIIRAFGKDICDWLYADPGGWNFIPFSYASWVSGGCWVLASALHRWLGRGSEMWAIWAKGHAGNKYNIDRMQHVVVRVGECFLDGDGASTERELLDRWKKEELLIEPHLKPMDQQHIAEVEIECPMEPVHSLMSAFNGMFGPGDRFVHSSLKR